MKTSLFILFAALLAVLTATNLTAQKGCCPTPAKSTKCCSPAKSGAKTNSAAKSDCCAKSCGWLCRMICGKLCSFCCPPNCGAGDKQSSEAPPAPAS